MAGGGSVRREFKQEMPEDSPDMMTLEDFLARAEAVEEQEAKAEPILGTLSVNFLVDHPILPIVGKRRAVMEPLDKIAQQRQKRMIKNRESAARSRERKQAYQAELESLAVRLEEEHEQLLKEQAERIEERRKQLMEKIIPVVEKRRPKRTLRRVQSAEW
jgi:ABA responsive element binding factor